MSFDFMVKGLGELPLVANFLLGTIFILILREKEVFWKAMFAGLFFVNIWYYINY